MNSDLDGMTVYKNHLMQNLQNELGKKESSQQLIKTYAMNAAQAELAIALEYLSHYKEGDAVVNITSMVSCLFTATQHPEAKQLLKKVLQSVLDNVKTS